MGFSKACAREKETRAAGAHRWGGDKQKRWTQLLERSTLQETHTAASLTGPVASNSATALKGRKCRNESMLKSHV